MKKKITINVDVSNFVCCNSGFLEIAAPYKIAEYIVNKKDIKNEKDVQNKDHVSLL